MSNTTRASSYILLQHLHKQHSHNGGSIWTKLDKLGCMARAGHANTHLNLLHDQVQERQPIANLNDWSASNTIHHQQSIPFSPKHTSLTILIWLTAAKRDTDSPGNHWVPEQLGIWPTAYFMALYADASVELTSVKVRIHLRTSGINKFCNRWQERLTLGRCSPLWFQDHHWAWALQACPRGSWSWLGLQISICQRWRIPIWLDGQLY